MSDFDHLHEILTKAVAQACEESSMLLGQDLTSSDDDCINTNRITFFSDSDDPIMAAEVESRDDYPGRFFIVFTLRDAILLSSLMLGIPQPRINEKRRLAIVENDDIDAFGEIMNQFIGSFNSVFQPSFSSKSHLKLTSHRKFIPGIDEMTDDIPLPEDEYFLCRFALNVPGNEMDKLDIFIPRQLASKFDPPAEQPHQESPSGDESKISSEENAAEVESSERVATILLLDDDQESRETLKASLKGTGLDVLAESVSADLRGIFVKRNVKLVVIGFKEPDDHSLSLCIKVSSMQQGGGTAPVILCAEQWTRSSVLKAIKYGAKDILMKQSDSDEVLKRASRLIQADELSKV